MRDSALNSDGFSFDHVYMAFSGESARGAAGGSVACTLLVGDPDEVFPLASVTKPIAAYAVLVAVERGLVDLDADAGPAGSTVRHLLAHASGLPAEAGEAIAKPGQRRIYSNYGFDVLAQAIESLVGMPIQEWIRESVLDPLEMDTAEIAGSIAHSGRASADSLARFVLELMNPQLISHELLTEAVQVQFGGIAGIVPGYGRHGDNCWGLGFELRGEKSPHWLGGNFSPATFGHFGQSGSFIWVDPQVNKAGLFLGAQNFGDEHIKYWPGLTDEMRGL
ncbi:CubicO group peptidase (beta-lactamase class C family) [Arcanobacterium pluranimalium]|uniref:serine hydrolase domain-containing protein n=1 Tax=Arcanobacterium pluranimalium TaxID=108028 RepID=UPI001956C8F2|nr:serine hydrolase domain-containing protein [Arcanobacterium pluranimalium]MBM7824236.1 CubicO group peptidase (beta-lactamase class C family) [Arcanobacterium pluranimalium]